MKHMSNKIESLSFFQIFASFFAIVILRLIIDNLVYPSPSGYFFQTERLIQLPFYFLSIFLTFSLAVYFLTQKSFKEIFNFLTYAFIFILIIPVIDFVTNGSSVDALKYVVINISEFPKLFIFLLNPYSGQGITLGQHVGVLAIFVSLSYFVYIKTKKFTKVVLSFILNYTLLFLYAIMPSILLIFNETVSKKQKPLEAYFQLINGSWLSHKSSESNFLIEYLSSPSTNSEIVMSRVFWLLIIVQLAIIFYFSNKSVFLAFIKNSRNTRIFYWLIIAEIGMLVSQKMGFGINFKNPINLLTLFDYILLIILNIWLAVFINDKEDVAIDKISNPARPLVRGVVSLNEWSFMTKILVLLIIFGLIIMERSVAILILLSQSLYYVYSVKPLKLKRNFITSSFVIGMTSVFISMSGFFLVSYNQHINAFPLKTAFLIFVSYALLSNLKDIKDYKGDSYENIKTLPVVFGLKKSKIIIATLCAIVLISVPVLLNLYKLLFISICIATFLFYLFTKKEYQERYVFLALFLYIFFLFLAVV